MSDTQQSKKLAAEFCRLYTGHDWAGLDAILSEDFRWRQPTSQRRQSPQLANAPLLDNEGTGWSKQELLAIFEQTIGAAKDGKFSCTPVSMTAEDDRVAVEAESYAVSAANGRIYDNRYHFLFVIRDGLIAELREYQDTLLVYDVWMAP